MTHRCERAGAVVEPRHRTVRNTAAKFRHRLLRTHRVAAEDLGEIQRPAAPRHLAEGGRRAAPPYDRDTRSPAGAVAARARRAGSSWPAPGRATPRAAARRCIPRRSAGSVAVARRGRRRRPRGLRFQHPMELLVRSILLGMAEGDPFGLNPQANPPDREARQAGQAGRRKGPAIVAANAVRQAILGERTLEAAPHHLTALRPQRVTAQHVATEAIPQGQRIAIRAIPGAEFPFEVVVQTSFGRVMGANGAAGARDRSRRRRARTNPRAFSRSHPVDRAGQAPSGSCRCKTAINLRALQVGCWRRASQSRSTIVGPSHPDSSAADAIDRQGRLDPRLRTGPPICSRSSD